MKVQEGLIKVRNKVHMKVERTVYFIKLQLTWKIDTFFNWHPVECSLPYC